MFIRIIFTMPGGDFFIVMLLLWTFDGKISFCFVLHLKFCLFMYFSENFLIYREKD